MFSFSYLESVYAWCIKLRKNYSHNNDIWDIRRHWGKIGPLFLKQMNDGTYAFKAMDVYIHDDAPTYLWSSLDMMALKLIAKVLSSLIPIPSTCYHTKGGLKKAVRITASHKSTYTYVFRSDVKSFYESITFDVLMNLIKRYVKNPILLALTQKALERAENCGGELYLL